MISRTRLQQQLADLQDITAPGKGINRLAFTDADWQGRAYLMGLMREAGMELREDAFGNVIGHVKGADESLSAVMFGSHGDSVPQGGNFDGIVGILAAIEKHVAGRVGDTMRFGVIVFSEKYGYLGQTSDAERELNKWYIL